MKGAELHVRANFPIRLCMFKLKPWHMFAGSWEKIVADFQDKHMFSSGLLAYRGMFQYEAVCWAEFQKPILPIAIVTAPTHNCFACM